MTLFTIASSSQGDLLKGRVPSLEGLGFPEESTSMPGTQQDIVIRHIYLKRKFNPCTITLRETNPQLNKRRDDHMKSVWKDYWGISLFTGVISNYLQGPNRSSQLSFRFFFIVEFFSFPVTVFCMGALKGV